MAQRTDMSVRCLRFNFLVLLLERAQPPTAQDAMLITDALVDYTIKGEIKGLSPARPAQQSRRATKRHAAA